MYFAEVNERGQITLPSKLRKELGLGTRAQLLLSRQKNGFKVHPVVSKPIPVENLFGSIKIKKPAINPDEAIGQAKKIKAKRSMNNE